MLESLLGRSCRISSQQKSFAGYAHFAVPTSASIRVCGILDEHGCLPWTLDPVRQQCDTEF